MSNRYKKWIKLLTLIAVVLFIFYWLYSHGTVEITVKNAGAGNISYRFDNQTNDKNKSGESGSANVKVRIGSGNYEITLRQGNKTAYLIGSAAHFLKTSHYTVGLAPESGVSFVGDNPSSCMFYTSRLYSYNCGQSLYNSINLHVPATADTPTYVSKINYGIEPVVSGIVTTGSQNIMLVKSVDFEGPSLYSLIQVDNKLAPVKQRVLDLPTGTTDYSIHSYGKGFLIYANDYSAVDIYSAFDSKPQRIHFDKPRQSGLTALGISFGKNDVSLLYSTGPGAKNPASELITYSGGSFAHYTIDDSATQALPCGTGKLCALTSGQMKVYQVKDGKTSYLYGLSGVNSIQSLDGQLLVINDTGVIDWNPDNKTGSISYSWGDYTFQSIQPGPKGYLLSIVDKSGNKRALLVSFDSSGDDIDKKVLALQALPQVVKVSIYQRYIFVAPDLGQMTYDQSTNTYGYDSSVKSSVNAKINQEVKKLGIDTGKYKIINTAE